LPAALAAAKSSCQEIWVAGGTYYPTANGTDGSLAMKSGVGIFGGFQGNETSRSQRDWHLHPTILTGQLPGGRQSLSSLIFNAQCDSSATLDGFILTGATNAVAVLNRNGAPVFKNCVFTNNGSGALYYDNAGSATLANCVFEKNQGQVGVALYVNS